MKIKGIIDEDFINYKKPCMVIEFPYCSMKCDVECGSPICQNSQLARASLIEISMSAIVKRYLSNDISQAIVFQGMEPFDSWPDLHNLINEFRNYTMDDIVIYTGYKPNEIENKLKYLKLYYNIIVKFGRFIPDEESHYDELLGVNLASPNQYAQRIS